MATESNIFRMPDEVETAVAPQSHNLWLTYLTVTLFVVLCCRLCRAFGLANRIHYLLIWLVGWITPSGRRSRKQRQCMRQELSEIAGKLKELNMVRQFAAYSKLERRRKEVHRQLDQLAPESLQQSFINMALVNVGLFAVEGLVVAWLTFQSPTQSVTPTDLEDAKHRVPYLYPVLFVLYQIPVRLAASLWIMLCYSTLSPGVSWLKNRYFTSDPVFAHAHVEN